MSKLNNIDKIDYFHHPAFPEAELLSMYTPNTILDMDMVLANKENWCRVYQDLLDIMKYGFERKEIRNRTIKFKMHEDSRVHEIQLRHLITNMFLWYAFVYTDSTDIMDDSFIFDPRMKSMKDIENYINDMILPNIEAESETKGYNIDRISFSIAAISKAFGPIIGLSFSIYNIIQTAKEYPEIEELMFKGIDPSLQPTEIEQELSARTDRLINIFCESDNDLRPLFLSGKNISKGQFKELVCMIGLKSDVNGKVIPYVADCNLLVDGINTPSSFLIDAASGRKSLMLSKLFMGVPGAFSKKATVNATDVVLRRDYQMCDTTRFISYNIINEDFLMMLNGRYYYDEENNMKCLDGKKDTHLIGKTIQFRGPATCNSKEGVCKFCYGKLYDINMDLFSAGAYAATMETEYLGQAVLSTKHNQQTDSQAINFNEDFNRDFELSSTDIILKDNGDADSELYIVFDEIFKENDDEDTVSYYVNGFTVIDDKHKELYKVVEENEAKLYLTPETFALHKKYNLKKNNAIPLDEFDSDCPIFEVDVNSTESTKSTELMKQMLNTKDHAGFRTIDELCQALAETKLTIGTKYDFVHHEMMVRSLMRRASDKMKYPDFGPDGNHEDYQILSINDSLYYSPSPSISLKYGYLRKQLLSTEFYKKTSVSHLDALLAPVLSDVMIDE